MALISISLALLTEEEFFSGWLCGFAIWACHDLASSNQRIWLLMLS